MGEKRRIYMLPHAPPTSGGGGGDPAVGGDLSGVASAATVVGIRGTPISATAIQGGQAYVYDAVAGEMVPAHSVKYFASGADAQTAAPHINGTFVIISPGSPTTEGGTYQVTADQGVAFPSDYTKVSDLTDTAGEVGIIDANGNFVAIDVEDALTELAEGRAGVKTVTPLLVTNNILDFFDAASYGSAKYVVTLVNGNLRYQATLDVVHDATTAEVLESDSLPGPGVTSVPITFSADIASGDVRLIATASSLGWSCRFRRLAVHPI